MVHWIVYGTSILVEEANLSASISLFLISDDSDLFFSMTGSMMSMSSPGHYADEMESSISSSISDCSTDTSRTGTISLHTGR